MLEDLLRRLSLFEPNGCPVISLYLNAQPDQHGHDRFQPFVRNELRARGKTFPPKSSEAESYQRDVGKIDDYLLRQVAPASNSVVLFACSGADLFEAIQLQAPIRDHHLYVMDRPHLYGLALLNDTYPRYAAVVADTHNARIFVFGLGQVQNQRQVENVKTGSRTVGGWSQQRYQRHVEQFHQRHVREVVEILDRIVREDNIQHVVLAGDEVVLPGFRDELPKHLASRVVDYLPLDIRTPEDEILQTTLEALMTLDTGEDISKVQRLLDEYRAGGLAVAGVKETLAALHMGQVDELLLSGALEQLYPEEQEIEEPAVMAAGGGGTIKRSVVVPNELVTKAGQTSASVTIIEDPSLLESVGGVGAFLRFRI